MKLQYTGDDTGGMRITSSKKSPLLDDIVERLMNDINYDNGCQAFDISNFTYSPEGVDMYILGATYYDRSSGSPHVIFATSYYDRSAAEHTMPTFYEGCGNTTYLFNQTKSIYNRSILEMMADKINPHFIRPDGIKIYKYKFGETCIDNSLTCLFPAFSVERTSHNKVYIKYEGKRVAEMSNSWIIKLDKTLVTKYNINKYSTTDLNEEFAKYLVNILNNR